MSGASKLNLFGKIYGTKMDYWVVSGVLGHVEEPNADSSVEKRGQGVNAMVYWVTDNILNDWIQLPECKPEYIVAARMIKHVMTGDLNASIDSNPPFPARSATSSVPKSPEFTMRPTWHQKATGPWTRRSPHQ